MADWRIRGWPGAVSLSAAEAESEQAVSAVADIAEAGNGSDSVRGGTVKGGGGGGLAKCAAWFWLWLY